MEREYIDFVTPVSKTKIVIKGWLTGREKRAIQAVYLNEASFKGEAVEIKGDLVAKAQDEAIRTVVVSVGEVKGEPEKVLNALLDLHDEDYQFVVAEINKMTRDKDEATAKK